MFRWPQETGLFRPFLPWLLSYGSQSPHPDATLGAEEEEAEGPWGDLLL